MADEEMWGLSQEEINERLRKQHQEKKANGPTRGGDPLGKA